LKPKFITFVLTAIGLLLVLVLTLIIFGMPVGPSLNLIAQGAFGDKYGIARTLVRCTPLLLTGLGITVAWRAGMYNIGGEGQFIVGGICGACVSKVFLAGHVPAIVFTGAVLVACVAGGAAYGALAGWLQAKRGVNVVISTILLNFVALQLLNWAVAGPLRGAGSTLPLTDEVPQAAMLYRPDHASDLNAGVLIALIAAVVMTWVLFRTKWGFLVRLVGENPRVATVNLVSPERIQVVAMAVSGGLCGLAGAVEYLGISGQLSTEFSQNWGFLAIPVALLGALHPLGLVLSAGYFGALMAGAANLARFSEGGDTLVYVIQSAAVLGLVGVRSLLKLRRPPVDAL
jgi:simple sugar transport system permease protein